MGGELRCYRCGESLAAMSLPIGRLEECPACAVQLHVCRMCVNFHPQVPKQCREDDAEEVREKERANFCDWFRPSPDAHDPRYARGEVRARGQLAALFGDDPADSGEQDPDTAAADDLFR